MGNPAYIKDSAGNWIELGSPTTDLSNYANLTTTPISGFRNAIINGDFKVWQRGTSFSNPSTNTYTADRWVVQHDGSGATRTISQQAFTPGNPISGQEPQYYLRYAVSAVGTSNTYNLFLQKVEDVRTFAGQTVTISFWAKADATRTVAFDVEQGFGSGGSGQLNTNFGSVSLTTSWVRYSLTVTVPSISGKTIGTNSYMGIRWQLPSNTTQTFDIWGVQLERGSIATPFEQRPIGTELALCQRYYYQSIRPNPGILFLSAPYATSQRRATHWFPVQMRTNPHTITSSNWAGGTTPSSSGNSANGANWYAGADFYADENTVLQYSAEL